MKKSKNFNQQQLPLPLIFSDAYPQRQKDVIKAEAKKRSNAKYSAQ